MRLLNTSTLTFKECYPSALPPYAILSHTWGGDEVSFQDMTLGNGPSKQGYSKIVKSCQLAVKHGLEWAWIDTCCIDKSSSAELTESINSMFEWYKRAVICYAFLEDLAPEAVDCGSLTKCRWFTRGWTLQELIAPETVEFHDAGWNHVGSKLDFIDGISTATGIPEDVLWGIRALSACSLACRMSWAASRETTRIEDRSYCLLGIFDVNMPLIYGEGQKAFRRLQEEIVKRDNDLTILAWDLPCTLMGPYAFRELFATSPDGFASSSAIVPFVDDDLDFSVGNKGLRILDGILRIVAVKGSSGQETLIYLICCGISAGQSGGIYLRKVGPKQFYRDGRFPLSGFGGPDQLDERGMIDAVDKYIMIDRRAGITTSFAGFRDRAIYIPPDNKFFQLEQVAPQLLWDVTDRVFLKPKPYSFTRFPMILATSFRIRVGGDLYFVTVLCDYRDFVPTCRIFESGQCFRHGATIFSDGAEKPYMTWSELERDAPDMLRFSNQVQLGSAHRRFELSVTLEEGVVDGIANGSTLYTMTFESSR